MSSTILHRAWTVTRIAFARLRFVAVFLITALIVGYWDDIKNHVDKWTRPAVAPDSMVSASAGTTEFYCPMHPDVVRQEQGQCPKCGMPLVKRLKGQSVRLPADVLARVQLTPQRVALANVHTTPVEFRSLMREIQAVGVLDYDETKLARLSARVAGRADELFVTFTGQAIKAGDPLYSLYSPDVYTAQREYLLARQRMNGLSGDAKTDASSVLDAAQQKLVLWGVTQQQLDKLGEAFDQTGKVPTNLTVTSPISGIVVRKDVTQGQYVQAGDAPFTVADLTVLWLKAKLYEQDVPLVKVGDAADVTVGAMPDLTLVGTVAFTAFQLDPETRTLDARVVVQNPALRLRPGMFANVAIRLPVTALTTGSGATTAPSTAPASAPSIEPAAVSQAYAAALLPYLKAHKLLSEDKVESVAGLLQETQKSLEPVKDADAIRPAFSRLAEAVGRTTGQPLPEVRKAWKDASAAMVEMGKAAGLPPDGPAVFVAHCDMKKAVWLQAGDQIANPYYGAQMFTCGDVVGPLPNASTGMSGMGPATQPRRANPSGDKVLAVPRSAVIDTGKDKIVYVESSAGVFDQKAVKLGPVAGDYYPILSGLDEGDRVVTVGTFLIDAENRLNPTKAGTTAGGHDDGGHQHAM